MRQTQTKDKITVSEPIISLHFLMLYILIPFDECHGFDTNETDPKCCNILYLDTN